MWLKCDKMWKSSRGVNSFARHCTPVAASLYGGMALLCATLWKLDNSSCAHIMV